MISGNTQQVDFIQLIREMYLIVDYYSQNLKGNSQLSDDDQNIIDIKMDDFLRLVPVIERNCDAFYKNEIDNIFKNLSDIQKRNPGSKNYRSDDLTIIRSQFYTLIFLIDNKRLSVKKKPIDQEENVRFSEINRKSLYAAYTPPSLWEDSWSWIKNLKITVGMVFDFTAVVIFPVLKGLKNLVVGLCRWVRNSGQKKSESETRCSTTKNSLSRNSLSNNGQSRGSSLRGSVGEISDLLDIMPSQSGTMPATPSQVNNLLPRSSLSTPDNSKRNDKAEVLPSLRSRL